MFKMASRFTLGACWVPEGPKYGKTTLPNTARMNPVSLKAGAHKALQCLRLVFDEFFPPKLAKSPGTLRHICVLSQNWAVDLVIFSSCPPLEKFYPVVKI